MKNKKLANLFLVFCFFAFLAAALLITMTKPKAGWSYYENRGLKAWTAPTAESVADGSFCQNAEAMLQDHAAGRNTLLKSSTWADLNLVRRPVVNQIIPSEDILLHYLAYSTPDSAAITAQAQSMASQLAALRDVVESYGGRYYHVAVPGQYAYFEDAHPSYLNNCAQYTDLSLAAFTKAMEEQDLTLIEMGGVFDRLGNPTQFYSRTDYHYSMAGAYQTYLTIMEQINRDRTEPLTVLQGDAVRFETLENPFLGSRARKIFGLWGRSEQAQVVWPTQPIPFTRTNYGLEAEASVYSLPASQEEQIAYSIYMGGDIGETVIDTGRDELPSVLIYGDSFTNPIEGLLYYSFNQLRSIDLRHYSEMSLAEYIRLHQPDVVLCVRDYEVLLSTDYNGSVF